MSRCIWVAIPIGLAFDFWAFDDQGANLTAQYLLSHGYRPGTDFGYHYGLLPLLWGRIWFDVFGLTPIACWTAMLFCEVFIVRGIARFVTALDLSRVAQEC